MRRARPLAFGAAVAVAACVEIATGPGGIASIRLLAAPPSIVAGDSLRDSTGAVVRLHAIAFDERGDSVADPPFRFTALALARDTTAAARQIPIVVDSLSGAVRAIGPTPLTPLGRVAVRIGDRLQVMDTIAVVKRPTRLDRAAQNGDSVQQMTFLCNDTGRVSVAQRLGDTLRIGNAAPVAVFLTADSTGTSRAPVPSHYVRFEIVSPATIPTVTAGNGTQRPAIGIIRDANSDRTTNTDTTESSGTANALLRVLPAGLPPTGAFAADTFSVIVRATARTSPTAIVPGPIEFVVRLARRRTSLSGGAATGGGCGS